MRKLFVTLMASLLSYSAAFAFWPEAAESSFSIGVGYRQDKLEWETKADTPLNDHTAKLSSELSWKDLNIWQIQAKGRYVNCDNIYFRGYANYGWIVDGKVTDKDFIAFDDEGSCEEFEVARSKADSDHGHVYDVSLGLGYQFRMCDDTVALTPVVGYSWHGQHLRLEHGKQCIPTEESISDLHSGYKTRWYGPWLGLDFDYRFCYDWTFFASYEYHWASYRGRGDWNLREDILGDFHHRSRRAYGNTVTVGINWELCDCWTVGVTGQWQCWRAKHGRDRVKILEIEEGDIDIDCYLSSPLNHVDWHSASITVDVGMLF